MARRRTGGVRLGLDSRQSVRRAKRPLRGRSRESGGARRRKRFAAVVGALVILYVTEVLLGTARSEWQRHQERNRIGSCNAVGDTPTVTCSGVTLVDLPLPASFAACDEIRPSNKGRCVVQVNREVSARFAAAVADIDRAGLGSTVTSFGTVNRRRCKDARTGEFISGCISKHSYGLAADVRAFADNARWDEVTRANPRVQEMIDVFRSHGFTWGMSFRSNPDPQHVEWTP